MYGLTNQAGALVGHQSYDVFGAPTPAPSGPAGQPFGFTGREHELDSGLVYARARYLQPGTGRWVTEDPVNMRTAQLPLGTERWLAGSGFGALQMLLATPLLQGRYLYAAGNPVGFADPTGEVLGSTVIGTLSLGALVIAAVAQATMLIGLTLFVTAVAIDDRALALDAAAIVEGAAFAMVVAVGLAALVNPYLIVGYLTAYWEVGAAVLYLGCMGMWGLKWYGGGCKPQGTGPAIYCTLALYAALRRGDIRPLLTFPKGL